MITKKGIVVSTKGDKTAVVKVTSYVEHSLYKKRVLKTKKFHAHDEDNSAVEGQEVTIQGSRPLSKLKRWVIVKETV